MPPDKPPSRWRRMTSSIYVYSIGAALAPVLIFGVIFVLAVTSVKNSFADRAATAVLCADTVHVRSYVIAIVAEGKADRIDFDEADKSIHDLAPNVKWAINVGNLQASDLAVARAPGYFAAQRLVALATPQDHRRIERITEAGSWPYMACSVTADLTTDRFSAYRKAVYTVAWPLSRYEALKRDIQTEANTTFDNLTLVILGLLLLAAIFAVLTNFMVFDGTLGRLRSEVEKVRDRRTNRIAGNYPREIAQLQDLLNLTIASHESTIESTRKLVTKIAHDINNRLQILVGAVSAEPIDRQAVRSAAAHMHELIERYRQLQGSASAQTPWSRSDVRIVEFVRDIVEVQRFDLQNRKVRYQVNAPGSGDDEITLPVNKTDIEIILSNLLSNASKYGRGQVEVDVHWDNRHVFIAICDNGPGIPPGKSALIFDDGYRLDVDTERPGSGFGLGIVRAIAELNSAAVSVAPGRLGGACFTLRLPLRIGQGETKTPFGAA